MNRVIAFLIMMPWWLYFPLAGGVGYLGELAYQSALETEAERATALESPMPDVVDLSDFSRTHHISDAKEVHVSGWINYDYNTNLIERTNLVKTGNHYLYVLFGSEDQAASKVARAALILTKSEWENFSENLYDYVDLPKLEVERPFFRFNGFAKHTHPADDHAYEVMEKNGLTRASGFVILDPFWQGREAALAPRGVPMRERMIFWLIGAGIALIGIVKLVFKRGMNGKRTKPDPFANGPIAGTAPVESAAKAQSSFAPQTPTMADSITDDSPLGRLNQRRLHDQQAGAAARKPKADSPLERLKAHRAATGEAPKPAPRPRATRSWRPSGFTLAAYGVVAAAIFFPFLSRVGAFSFLPLVLLVGFWASVYWGFTKLRSAFAPALGVKAKPDTGLKLGGLNIVGLPKGFAGKASKPGKSTARGGDPFDKLARQARGEL
ncbi:hypothetical protein [Aliiroseovarius subalbicans]|uniref:hypothetical protein n=1 Tax=Aliiroseovarius subalbicans TaxID=2925840 RepID=UPI001F577B11|nr:hypothetical protein [Aliiroseovarius subalbicans]MCI2399688.1 hypothetical protein [Aliiroseovarius subalbicans]